MSKPPYYQSGQPPQGFGRPPAAPPPYPYQPGPLPYPVPREHPQGTTVLLLGILGLFFSPVAFVAWYLGSKAQEEIELSGQVWSNAGSIRAGRILGMVMGILTIVSAALTLLVMIAVLLGIAGLLSALT
jgi:hypothetical protein